MSTFPRQFFGRGIDLGLSAITVTEPIKVGGLGGSVDKISDAPTPQRGSLHPDQARYPGAVVDRIRLREWMNRDEALVDVIYRRQLTGYSGGPRPISRSSVGIQLIDIPVWNASTPVTGGPTYWTLTQQKFERATVRRVEVRFLTGSFAAIQDAITSNIGNLYVISSQTYKFVGGDATYDGLGYTRVAYQFSTNARIASIGVGVIGNGVAIPVLPQLSEYWTTRGVFPPVVGTAPINAYAAAGGTLPGL